MSKKQELRADPNQGRFGYDPEHDKILKKVYPSAQPSGMAVGSQRNKIERS